MGADEAQPVRAPSCLELPAVVRVDQAATGHRSALGMPELQARHAENGSSSSIIVIMLAHQTILNPTLHLGHWYGRPYQEYKIPAPKSQSWGIEASLPSTNPTTSRGFLLF